MLIKEIDKDERTTFIENRSYKYGHNILAFGILLDIEYRAIRFHQSSWDLFLLIFIAGFVMTFYQYRQKIFTENRKKSMSFMMLFIMIFGAVLAFILKKII